MTRKKMIGNTIQYTWTYKCKRCGGMREVTTLGYELPKGTKRAVRKQPCPRCQLEEVMA